MDEVDEPAPAGSTSAPAVPCAFTVCSLLYVDDAGSRPVNLRNGKADPLDIYVACAAFLARSAHEAGERFVLVTNRAEVLVAAFARLGLPTPALQELELQLSLPRDIPFYQAHFKLALIKALGQGACGPAAALLDLDMVICKPFTGALASDRLTAYDITDQAPDNYLRSLTPLLSAPARHWYGGEFLADPAEGFARLSERVQDLSPAYMRDIHGFAHIGDETAEVEGACVLHLPSDKPLLAREAASSAPVAGFAARYRASVRPKLLVRAAAQLMRPAPSGRSLYAARLGSPPRQAGWKIDA